MFSSKKSVITMVAIAVLSFPVFSFAAPQEGMNHEAMAPAGAAQPGMMHNGTMMQGNMQGGGMMHNGTMMQGNMQGGGMMHNGTMMKDNMQGGGMMHNGTMMKGGMQGGMMDAAMMQTMMNGMMKDMKDGKMMKCMMQGGMMQAKAHDKMRHDGTFSDKAFLSAMIPHHQAAIEMADAVLKTGKDPQVKKWAQAVKAAQAPEIKEMTAWLTAMGGEDQQAAAMMQESMHSMMTTPMSADPDVNFVTMMISHHASAVEMSVPAVVSSKDAKITKLANEIITSQLKEINEYKGWLAKKK